MDYDPDDLTTARRIMDQLDLPEEYLPVIMAEILGGATRRARQRYLDEGAANDGVEWYPGRWSLSPKD